MTDQTAAGGLVPVELKQAYELIDAELQEVSNVMLEKLQHDHPYIDKIVRYSFQLGGKRLRPVLVLICGRLAGQLSPKHILAAAAMEMIHTGTLVHDDILDGASFRRHLKTIHMKWDPKSAVLAGDLLLTEAMRIITACEDISVYREIALACQTTCEGELMQTGERENFAMTREEYFKIISGKTAALLACCCYLGGYFAGATPEFCETLREFGRSLGLAFQIIDDILDLTGNEDEAGKTLGTDILNGKPTLPILIYRETASPEQKAAFLSLMTNEPRHSETFKKIRDILLQSNAVDAARKEAQQMVESALAAISQPGMAVDSVALTAVSNVAQFVISRNR